MLKFGFFKSKTFWLLKLTRHIRNSWSDSTGLPVVAISTLMIAGVVLGVRHLGGMQPLELLAWDQMVRLRPDAGSDPRLLVVAVTEEDIRRFKKWPLSDQAIAQALAKLQQYQPTVIGLDLYRDIPIEPGHQQLVAQLQKPNVIAIRNIDNVYGTSAPPEAPASQIGFNDFPLDPDGVIRRNALFAKAEQGVLYSLSLRLAIAHLKTQGILPASSQINPKYLQLRQSTFIPLKENPGQYQSIDDGYQILLNYRSPREVARTIPLYQVLQGKFSPDWVKGKIILIGSTAPSLKDDFYTPYSPTEKKYPKMAGVFLHAQLVSQFLDAATGERSLFWFWSESMEVMWIVGWTLLGSLLAWGLRHPLALIFSFGGGLVLLSGTCFYLFTQQGWVPVTSPAIGFVLAGGILITYRSYEAQQQQQIVMKLLGQNTSPEVAKALWKGRDRLLKSGKLPGQKLSATILFSDIKDFSSIAEHMPPEALLEWLNELLDMMAHEILTREGIINKFTGDGVMAVFGVPMSRIHKEEMVLDAQRAVDCAMVISDHLEELNLSWKSRGLPVIQMRVGIYTGPIVVGSLGGKDRLEYGVIGDAVNTASRLESCEKDRQPSNCRVLIARETLVHLQDHFQVESWGALALKGKEQMVEVYRVIRRSS